MIFPGVELVADADRSLLPQTLFRMILSYSEKAEKKIAFTDETASLKISSSATAADKKPAHQVSAEKRGRKTGLGLLGVVHDMVSSTSSTSFLFFMSIIIDVLGIDRSYH